MRFRRVLAWLAIAFLGCGRDSRLCVAVIGDYGDGSEAEGEVSELVHGFHPDLVVTVGDNNYPKGAAETIDAHIGRYYADFISPYHGALGQGGAVNRFFPSLGNHDWGTPGAKPYLDYFELPGNERYYDVVRGDVHLFFLDSDPHEPDGITRDSAQARWLHDALARATERHRWVLFHHPPYSSGPHGANPELQWPFRAWGATAVICGHDHLYERLARDGMTYLTMGAGGARLYEFGPPLPGSAVRIAGKHGALKLEVAGDRASGEFLAPNVAALDSFELAPASALAAPVPLLAGGSSWRVLDGAEPKPGWRDANFDTTTWASAAVPLRIFDSGAAAQARTIYYRTEFELAKTQPGADLELGLPRDQAATAFLNGHEVARIEPGEVKNWLVPRGPRADSGTAPILVHRPLDPALLLAGTNVLVVEVQRVPAQGGDPSFDAELVSYPGPRL